tara:strand:+ start:50 stop:403 length:354 start_codon:yes stop_codon:yes gene_type:complete
MPKTRVTIGRHLREHNRKTREYQLWEGVAREASKMNSVLARNRSREEQVEYVVQSRGRIRSQIKGAEFQNPETRPQMIALNSFIGPFLSGKDNLQFRLNTLLMLANKNVRLHRASFI